MAGIRINPTQDGIDNHCPNEHRGEQPEQFGDRQHQQAAQAHTVAHDPHYQQQLNQLQPEHQYDGRHIQAHQTGYIATQNQQRRIRKLHQGLHQWVVEIGAHPLQQKTQHHQQNI